MTLPGETVATGAKLYECPDCGQVPMLQVCQSAAGYYIGYFCCSPYSRESGYYLSRAQAAHDLDAGTYWRP